MKLRTLSILSDMLTGLVILLSTVLVAMLTNMQTSFMAACLIGLGAGFTRGKAIAEQFWAHAMFTNVVSVPISLLPSTQSTMMLIFPAAILVFTLLGLVVGFRWSSISAGMKTAHVVLPVTLACVAGFVGLPWIVQSHMTENVHSPAPRFELALLADGSTVSSRSFEGRVLVIDFWATWCRPCVAEFEQFQKIYARYKDDPRIAILAVNTSWRGDTKEKATAFAHSKRYEFPMAFDDSGRVTNLFSVEAIPTLVVIDSKGNMRVRHKGFDQAENLFLNISRQIEELLAEGR